MSRCFPYPPPGYALSRASKDALTESIKLQNEVVKSKEQRKVEKKKEKKEKHEKKQKAEHKLDKPSIGPSQFGENLCAASKLDLLFNRSKAEQLERSSVTEEHGKPVNLIAPSTSSDSTENSNKRKRHPSMVEDTSGHGKIIRLRVTLKKPSQLTAPANEQNEQPCFSFARTSILSQKQDVAVIKNERNWVCSTSQPTETPIPQETPNLHMACSLAMTPMQKLELQYSNLMDTLVPPQQLGSCFDEADDLDWLLKSENQKSCAEKKKVSGNEVFSSCGSSGLWPRAQYLKDVDVFALPFTIPY